LPRVLEQVDAEYPEQALLESREAIVELLVTLRADGSIDKVEVVSSSQPEFDTAALAAIYKWQFSPALKDGVPSASRIRVPFHFVPPHSGIPGEEAMGHGHTHAHEPVGAPQGAAAAPTSGGDSTPTPEPLTVDVEGERALRPEVRSSGDFLLDAELLNAAPRAEGVDVLKSVPGLYVARGEGQGVAHSMMLRGFDAEHGQDIEMRVGGIPINLPSHIHGQGYADLNLLSSNVVRRIRVKEGVYDPAQGDFAVAGSLYLDLGVEPEARGVFLRSSYGSFSTFRQLAVIAPKSLPVESFASGEFSTTGGFGENRQGQSGRLLVQHRFGQGAFQHRILAIGYASRAGLAGVVRRDDIASEKVCFLCVYDDTSTKAQNATSSRILAGFFSEYRGQDGEGASVGAWLSLDDFRLLENFTGYIQRSRTLPGVVGRGDLIEQRNRTQSLGFSSHYRTKTLAPAAWLRSAIELGLSGRIDDITQDQALVDAAVHNQTWDTRVAANILATDLGLYGDLEGRFGQLVTARAGVRGELLSYNVDDALGNFAELSRPKDSYIPGFRRSALGSTLGPRVSVEVRPLENVTLLAAYGQGFRSPQARTLSDGEPTPFTTVQSFDLGARLAETQNVSISLGGYYTHLSEDVAFDPSEAQLERAGPSQRLGATLHSTLRLVEGLVAAVSVTWTDARLVGPPPPSSEEPSPPFTNGSQLPYVPPWVARFDLSARRALFKVASRPVVGQASLGFNFLAPRPLPYGQWAEAVALLDAQIGLHYGAVSLGLEAYNLLDSRYAALEYAYASDFNPNDSSRSRVPERHVAAGAPLTLMASLGLKL